MPNRCGSYIARALVVPVPLIFRLFVSKETVGYPKFVSCPSMHMPRSRIPVVPLTLAICALEAAAFHINQCVGFPRSCSISLRTTILLCFRDSVSRPAHSLPLCFAHPFSGIALRFSYSPAGYALARRDSHPLGNINRFQCL